jgi:hypothetical protein
VPPGRRVSSRNAGPMEAGGAGPYDPGQPRGQRTGRHSRYPPLARRRRPLGSARASNPHRPRRLGHGCRAARSRSPAGRLRRRCIHERGPADRLRRSPWGVPEARHPASTPPASLDEPDAPASTMVNSYRPLPEVACTPPGTPPAGQDRLLGHFSRAPHSGAAYSDSRRGRHPSVTGRGRGWLPSPTLPARMESITSPIAQNIQYISKCILQNRSYSSQILSLLIQCCRQSLALPVRHLIVIRHVIKLRFDSYYDVK